MNFSVRPARPLLAGLAALSLGYFACECFFHIYQWNTEGLLMVDAYQLYHGLRPYRDFVTYAPPGIIYLLGAIFKVAGPSIVVSRFLTTCLPKWGIALSLYRVVRRAGLSAWTAASAGGLATLALGTGTFSGNDYSGVQPTVICTLLAVLAAWAVLVFLQDGGRRPLILAGLATGVNAAFRYDIGLYSLLACAAALVLGLRLGPARRGEGAPRALAVYAAAVAAVVLPVAGWLLATAPWRNLALSFVAYPRAYLRLNTRLGPANFFPSPVENAARAGGPWLYRLGVWGLYDAFRTLIFATYLWAAVRLFARRRAGSWGRAEQALLVLSLLGLFLWGYFIKSDNVFAFSAPMFALLPSLAALDWRAPSPAARGVSRLMALWAAGLAALMFACKPILPRPYHRLTDIPAARGLLIPEGEAESVSALVKAVDALVPPGGRILVADRYFNVRTPLELYVLAGRLPATAVFDFFPGVTTRPDVERGVLDDLRAGRAQAIIQGGYADPAPPPAADRSPRLEAFVASHFEEAGRFGAYRLLRPVRVR